MQQLGIEDETTALKDFRDHGSFGLRLPVCCLVTFACVFVISRTGGGDNIISVEVVLSTWVLGDEVRFDVGWTDRVRQLFGASLLLCKR